MVEAVKGKSHDSRVKPLVGIGSMCSCNYRVGYIVIYMNFGPLR